MKHCKIHILINYMMSIVFAHPKSPVFLKLKLIFCHLLKDGWVKLVMPVSSDRESPLLFSEICACFLKGI